MANRAGYTENRSEAGLYTSSELDDCAGNGFDWLAERLSYAEIKELNKDYFDTGGIDPASNIGVFNFKKGLKGRLATNGPLWSIGSNKLVVWFMRMFFL